MKIIMTCHGYRRYGFEVIDIGDMDLTCHQFKGE